MKIIVIEGIDGSGKTTLIQHLTEKLKELKKPFQVFQGLGSSSVGLQIKELFINGPTLSYETRFHLALANMAQIQKENINPYFKTDTIVILDRWFPSTFAYQIFPYLEHPQKQKQILYLQKILDLVVTRSIEVRDPQSFQFLLDIEPEKALQRKQTQMNHQPDWIENQPISHFNLIRQGYLHFFQFYRIPNRTILKGDDSLEKNSQIILQKLKLK
ncbi:dTMP kinase ['Camptotheca acuminata' phytoplasma]|uniref:dTMP kinase n=1 Tax='Camptotheca acuminata' phytoplasma TaxID=3239192 RepID=UPI00351A9E7C